MICQIVLTNPFMAFSILSSRCNKLRASNMPHIKLSPPANVFPLPPSCFCSLCSPELCTHTETAPKCFNIHKAEHNEGEHSLCRPWSYSQRARVGKKRANVSSTLRSGFSCHKPPTAMTHTADPERCSTSSPDPHSVTAQTKDKCGRRWTHSLTSASSET